MGEIADILSGHVRYSPHGETELKPYEPSLRDSLAMLMSRDPASHGVTKFVQGLMGSTGIGHTSTGLVDVMPYLGSVFGIDDGVRAGSPKDVALSALGILPFKAAPPPNIGTYGPTRTIWDKTTAGAANAADHYLIQNEPEVDADF